MSDKPIPSFRKPPVVETVLGVQFDRIPGFKNAHLGAFWKHLLAHPVGVSNGDHWEKVDDVPPIEPVIERFDDDQAWSQFQPALRLTQDASTRLQIRNSSGDAMIQIQNGRLHYNWIGQPGKDYRRYKIVRPLFDAVYDLFKQFLSDNGLSDLHVNQWEVTYVNHILKDTVWTMPSDWPKLFVGLPGMWANPTQVSLESFAGAWHFEIPPKQGRLHVDLKHARSTEPEGSELLRFTLTARGPASDDGSGAMPLSEGLDLGRKVVVDTFCDITSADAHKYWGLE